VTRHADAETLARYRHEDLSRRRASRIRAHLAGCARCRALDEDLAGVTALLADAQPPPMPEHLAARIQTAIAAEAARRVALPAQAASAVPGGATAGEARQASAEPASAGVPDGRAAGRGRHGRDRTRPRRPGFASPVALRAMAAAAAVVVLAGGGYEIAQHVGGSRASGTPATTSGRQPQNAPYSAPAAAPLTPRYLHAGHRDVLLIASGTNYLTATLRDQVRSTLTHHPPPTTPGPSAARQSLGASGSSSETFGSIPESTLAGCVTRIAAGQQVLLVDVARYQGRPATVIVTRASSGGLEQVWVVSTGCSSRSITLIAHTTLAPAG
jgi:hypothetical protein